MARNAKGRIAIFVLGSAISLSGLLLPGHRPVWWLASAACVSLASWWWASGAMLQLLPLARSVEQAENPPRRLFEILKPLPLVTLVLLLVALNLRRVAQAQPFFDFTFPTGFVLTIGLPVLFPLAIALVLLAMRGHHGSSQHT